MLIKVEATAEQLSALMMLLNVGLQKGAYDLSQAEAVVFWARKIEDSSKQLNDSVSEQE